MKIGDLTVPEFVSLLSLLITIIGWLFTAINQKRLQEQNYELKRKGEKGEFIKEQLSAFYDPILVRLKVNNTVFSRFGPNSAIRHNQEYSARETAKVWRTLIENVILPNNEEICKIISEKKYLLAEGDDLNIYIDFVTHAQAYSVFKNSPFEAYSEFQFPVGFDQNVEKNQRLLMEMLNNYYEKGNI